jgi:pyridinium-3,5-bisthiocarboxylic acid mononucleotide nickel chelatase
MAEPDPGTIAWFHCFAGISGDMALGSLLDAGADLDDVRALLERLPVDGWTLDAEPTMRSGISATRALVSADDSTVVRTYANIRAIVEGAVLPDRVRDRALAVFDAIAVVESQLHRRELAQVHFHEVGGIDAIVDVVGVAAALEVLDVDSLAASPVANGLGMVRTAHGMLPNPAPAVVALLEGRPTYGLDISVELTTPTGAGILAALATQWGPLPAMTIRSSGFGAGSRELDEVPNTTQVVIGAPTSGLQAGQPTVLLETNVDDATGETLAHSVAALLDAGAHDAWITPIVMKKGRPAHTVSALVDVAVAGAIADVMRKETGTLGVRGTTIDRWPDARAFETVSVEGHDVRVKVSARRVKVEHDDAAAVAVVTGLSLREVVSRAEEAWRNR